MHSQQPIKPNQISQKRLIELVIIAAAAIFVVIIFAMLAQQLPIGVDYHFTFRPVARDWLNGETQLYDDNGHGYFNAPWALILILPLSLPSFVVGQALWNSLSLFGLLAAIHLLRQHRTTPTYVVIAAILNFHTLDLFIRGQIDVLILLGVVSGWWAIQNHKPWILSLAICLLGIKPINVILVGILFLIAVRDWSFRDLAKVIALPILAVLGSAFVIGFDWLIRYVEFSRQNPLFNEGTKITIWKAADLYGLPYFPFIILGIVAVGFFLRSAWHTRSTLWMIGVAIATNLLFTTHANGNHYILLIPALLYLATQNKWLFALAYLSTYTPLSRLALGSDYSWVDIVYPLILLLTSWYFGLQDTSKIQQMPKPSEITMGNTL